MQNAKMKVSKTPHVKKKTEAEIGNIPLVFNN